jgi:3-oxoacyl-[acyl-carrier-protein] synthase-3
MRAAVSGIGVWFPPRVRVNSDWPTEFVEAARFRGDRTLVDIPPADVTEADRITATYAAKEGDDPFLGTTRRRVADDSMKSWQSEVLAAERALQDAKVDAKDVDVVLSWTVALDRVSPAGASKVAYELGAKRAWGAQVDGVCASSVVHLAFAKALIESGQARHVLLTQSNLMNRVFPLLHPASPTIGDAATAMLVSASERPGILSVKTVSHGEHYDSICYVRGRDDESDPPWYREGGPYVIGSRDPASMKELMRHTVRFAAETTELALRDAGLRAADVDALCVTQPRRFIPFAVADLLRVAHDKTPNTFDDYAHLGASGVVVNLWAAREAGLLAPGRIAALYSQGAGFVRSAAVLRWLPDRA